MPCTCILVFDYYGSSCVDSNSSFSYTALFFFKQALLRHGYPRVYNRPVSGSGGSGGSVVGAVVGGVGLLLNHEPTLMFQKAGMLSPEGRCKTLDASADGWGHQSP